jgi:hypothetical protein
MPSMMAEQRSSTRQLEMILLAAGFALQEMTMSGCGCIL